MTTISDEARAILIAAVYSNSKDMFSTDYKKIINLFLKLKTEHEDDCANPRPIKTYRNGKELYE